MSLQRNPVITTRWVPSSYKWSYNPYKWPYKWVPGDRGYNPTYRGYNSMNNWLGPTLYLQLFIEAKVLPMPSHAFVRSPEAKNEVRQILLFGGVFWSHIRGVRWMYPYLPTYPVMGNPYISPSITRGYLWAIIIPKNPIREHNKYHGYTVRGTSNCPLTIGSMVDWYIYLRSSSKTTNVGKYLETRQMWWFFSCFISILGCFHMFERNNLSKIDEATRRHIVLYCFFVAWGSWCHGVRNWTCTNLQFILLQTETWRLSCFAKNIGSPKGTFWDIFFLESL